MNKSLRIPHGKGGEKSFFYAVCYVVRFEKNQKENKCKNAVCLFSQLDLVRKALILDFDFNTFERECFLVSQILMHFNFFFRFSELHGTFRYLVFPNSEKRNIVRNVLSCITEKFNGYKIVRHKSIRKMRKIFHLIDLIFKATRSQKREITCLQLLINSLR